MAAEGTAGAAASAGGEGLAATTTAARGAPTPDDFWSLATQVNGIQSAINALVASGMEVAKKSASTEEFSKQRIGQYDAELAKLQGMVEGIDVKEVIDKAEAAEMRVKTMMEEMKATMEEGKKGTDEGTRNRQYRKHKEPRTFIPPAKGAEAQFKSWSFVFNGHMESLIPGSEAFLEWVSRQEDELDDSILEDYEGHGRDGFDAIAASRTLYDELRGLCPEGEPQTAIRNAKKGKCGAEAWEDHIPIRSQGHAGSPRSYGANPVD